MPCNHEKAFSYSCKNEEVIGIQHISTTPSEVGALIVVGGPQYRVGSHQLFVLLARSLANNGIHAFRFDLRGMGDSSGDHPGFEHCTADINAALDTFKSAAPHLKKIMLIGLCDGAFATTLDIKNKDIAGLCLINPWIQSEQTEAKAYIHHYYKKKIINLAFWRRLLSLRVNLLPALIDFLSKFKKSRFQSLSSETLEAKLYKQLIDKKMPIHCIISSEDLTGQAFLEVSKEKHWSSFLNKKEVSMEIIQGANHTFSTKAHQDTLFISIKKWIKG